MRVGDNEIWADDKARTGAVKHTAFAGLQDHDDAHDAAFGFVNAGLRRRWRRKGHEQSRDQES
jgi:hypothetical protein